MDSKNENGASPRGEISKNNISTENSGPASVKARQYEIEKIYRSLALELRSTIQKLDDGDRCKCLVRFHNCTPYRVTPFWIDFKGLPIKYAPLPRGASINLDTYASHLWFFKAHNTNSSNGSGPYQSEPIKVLAIPEETLDVSLLSSLFPEMPNQIPIADRRAWKEAMIGPGNTLICSLCKFVLKQCSRSPPPVPCPHFRGEAKFSVTDLERRAWSSHNSSYIYSCSEDTHRREHSESRRDIFLVEPFHNLRERCFLALKERIRHADIVNLKLPVSLQKEYLQFITTLKKLNENNKNV